MVQNDRKQIPLNLPFSKGEKKQKNYGYNINKRLKIFVEVWL